MSAKVYRGCKWIIEKLKRNKRLTLDDFIDLWHQDENINNGGELNTRTFHRLKKTLNDVFGINIVNAGCGDYAYYIGNPEVLGDLSLGEWMLNTLAISEKLSQCMAIKERILLEDIPSGNVMLEIISDAMLDSRKIDFKYLKYGAKDILESTLEPYALVLYHLRWYVLGKLGNGKLYTFGLDRIKTAKICSRSFVMDATFSAKAYFDDMIGIFDSGERKQQIIIRAFGDEPYYLRDLPLHHSQREIGSGDGYTDFMIEVKPNNELIGSLLFKKNRVKVLSPASLAEQIKNIATDIKNLYE